MKIGVIGLGYVGLPRCLQFLKKGFTVYGFDTDLTKITQLKNKNSYLTNVDKKDIKKYINKKFFVFNTFEKIKYLDFIIICLPTPLKNKNLPDLSIIKNVLKKIYKFLQFKQCISLESTTYPGSTEELFLPLLKKKFLLGKNLYLVYSPERNDPGLELRLNKIPKIVSGYSSTCKKKGKLLYSKIFKKIILTSNIKTAEMTKLYENIFRAVNISLVNETRIILSKFKIDINEVVKSASTKPFGFMPFYPGPGFGGHCIPVDPFYFVWRAKQMGVNANFI
jgi:UDP-N-acetyl-D-glucosamine dehydrogenase